MTLPSRIALSSALTMGAMVAVPAMSQECGEWTITPNPEHDGTEFRPTLIAAFAPDSAVAFGLLPGTGLVRTDWDGAKWSPGFHDPPDLPSAAVRAVTGSGPNDFWITGEYLVGSSIYWPYLAHFDGSAWDVIEGSLLDAPGSVQRSGGGSDMVVIAPDDIWAVGVGDPPESTPPGAILGPISMHWNGSSYEEFVPQVEPVYNSLNRVEAIAAVASDAVWFVGSGRNLGTPDANIHHFIYRFDGSAWIPQLEWNQLPGSESVTEKLYDVVAFASDDVWALGEKFTLAEGTASLYLHWDGSSWNEVAGPDIGPITSAAAGGPNEAWASCAFGEYGGEFAHWDGATWTVRSSASIPGATHIGLTNLATSPSGDVWAIGYWAIYDGQGGWDVYEDILEHFVPGAPADLDGDGVVGVSDLLVVLAAWGTDAGDVNGDGTTDVADLLAVLSSWGNC